MANEQQLHNTEFNLLDQPGNYTDYARRVGAPSFEAAHSALEAELEVYRLRESGAAVLEFA